MLPLLLRMPPGQTVKLRPDAKELNIIAMTITLQRIGGLTQPILEWALRTFGLVFSSTDYIFGIILCTL